MRLSTVDRDFFRLINEVGSTNFFSAKRLEIERRITDGKNDIGEDNSVPLVILNVLRRVKELEKTGKVNWRGYCEEDSRLLHGVLLFDVYYRFTEAFDRLIHSQIKSGDSPCAAPFAKDAIGLLVRRGFYEEEAVRYFAIYYQLRRAFHFIHYG
ncbi:MAG: sigma-54-dependent Fis family transcriptional regulator, partial [Desulfuromonadales bacterium]